MVLHILKPFQPWGRRRVREISGLQQNSALREPQLDLTREFASKGDRMHNEMCSEGTAGSGRTHPEKMLRF